jgi:hypothetical protein
MAGDPQGNRLAGSQEAFPRQRSKALLKLGESGGIEKIPQASQDTAGNAQMEVGAIESRLVTLEEDATGFH